jgi:CheY-like chemotaxis protein
MNVHPSKPVPANTGNLMTKLRFAGRLGLLLLLLGQAWTAWAGSGLSDSRQIHQAAGPHHRYGSFGLTRQDYYCIALVLVFGMVVMHRQIIEYVQTFVLDRKFWTSGWKLAPAASKNVPGPLAEEAALSDFRIELQSAPLVLPLAAADLNAAGAFPAGPGPAKDLVKEFFDWAPGHLSALRTLCQTMGRIQDKRPTKEMLVELYEHIHLLKDRANLPALLPLHQMAAALDGLVKQLIPRLNEFTPSTLRTLASGIDLLDTLCVPDQKADLATNPHIQILAVDDDAVSRTAVSFSLKKAFEWPDLAEDGQSALALAVDKPYDVIFLDIRMPGMDGFELCTKIHETAANRVTPVIFITGLTDFEARAKSVVSGGSDLIAKPFLSFEIAVKALTFALRRRLQAETLAAVPA